MYKREVIKQLREWSGSESHKPLVIRGARQVGKSTLVREFGREFDVFIEVNLELSEDAEIFVRTDNVMEIWQYLCTKNHVISDPAKRMLLFIDEIQELPQAVAMLRYFYEKMPWLYVITAGSRLQNLLKSNVSFPVSRVEYLNLRPFSFMEYLNAMEGDAWCEMIRELEVPAVMHDAFIRHFNRYALVGGMPEIVSLYARYQDVVRLSSVFSSLLKGYNEDVEHYVRNGEQVRVIRHILETAWYSAGEIITFAKFGNSSFTSRQIHDAMDCLERAYLLSLDYPVTATSVPAIPSLRRAPKLIMLDIGITNFAANIQTDYLPNKELSDTWRGRAAEQVVAQELRVLSDQFFKEKQFFWVRDKKGSVAEIDFIWQQDAQLVPVEVKAGAHAHLRSLHSFVRLANRPVTAVRVWSGGFSVTDAVTPDADGCPYRLINVPFYYIGQLPRIIREHGI